MKNLSIGEKNDLSYTTECPQGFQQTSQQEKFREGCESLSTKSIKNTAIEEWCVAKVSFKGEGYFHNMLLITASINRLCSSVKRKGNGETNLTNTTKTPSFKEPSRLWKRIIHAD